MHTFYFNSSVATYLKSPKQIEQWAQYEIQAVMDYIDKITGSNFELRRINYLKTQHAKSKKTLAGSYRTSVIWGTL